MEQWVKRFESKIAEIASDPQAVDPAHDLLHFKRVAKTAQELAQLEHAKLEIVVPAAWLHDFVIVPKNDPRRSQASRLSATAALEYLASIGYPREHFEAIGHAIECHSFSAAIPTRTIEARVVQDADRLDGLGAIGIARCFSTSGLLKTTYYDALDPFCKTRAPNDQQFTIDHFYKKLFRVVDLLQTEAGRREGRVRAERMRRYLSDLQSEILD